MEDRYHIDPGVVIKNRKLKCPVCKEVVWITSEHAWTIGDKTFCRYNCMRQYEREKAEKEKQKQTKNYKGRICKWKASIEAARERLKECEAKIEEYDRLAHSFEDKRKKDNAWSQKSNWRKSAAEVQSWIAVQEMIERDRRGQR